MSHQVLFPPLEVDTEQGGEEVVEKGSFGTTAPPQAASSGSDFRHENGRRYHAFEDDAYFLPNDDMEAARLDLQHYIWKLTFNNTHGRVPINDHLKTVLDVGTGTGIWALELATRYPNLHVIGIDLSPIQPQNKLSNCEFVVRNAEHDWKFNCQFDYIHARMLTMGMHDWDRFFAQCWENLAPGGWLETADTQFPPRCTSPPSTTDPESASPFVAWGSHVLEAAAKAGINGRASELFTEKLQAQGFVNVERVNIQWPLGSWAKGKKEKLMGRLLWENTLKGVPGIGLALFMKQLGWSRERVDEVTEAALRDVEEGSEDRRYFYYPMVSYVAQKPA